MKVSLAKEDLNDISPLQASSHRTEKSPLRGGGEGEEVGVVVVVVGDYGGCCWRLWWWWLLEVMLMVEL